MPSPLNKETTQALSLCGIGCIYLIQFPRVSALIKSVGQVVPFILRCLSLLFYSLSYTKSVVRLNDLLLFWRTILRVIQMKLIWVWLIFLLPCWCKIMHMKGLFSKLNKPKLSTIREKNCLSTWKLKQESATFTLEIQRRQRFAHFILCLVTFFSFLASAQ